LLNSQDVLAKLSASQQREFKRMLEALGPD